MTKMTLTSDCLVELQNHGPFKEVVLLKNIPIVVYPNTTLRLNDGGRLFKRGAQVSYNSLTINVKERYEGTSRDCNSREVNSMWDDRKDRRILHEKTRSLRLEGAVKDN